MTSVLLAATELAELERGDGTWENIQVWSFGHNASIMALHRP